MMVRTAVELGALIRDQRRKSKVSQADLARRVNVSRQWIVAVEKGKPGAELGLVLKTLSALGLQLHINTPEKAAPAPANFVDVPIDLNALLSPEPKSK